MPRREVSEGSPGAQVLCSCPGRRAGGAGRSARHEQARGAQSRSPPPPRRPSQVREAAAARARAAAGAAGAGGLTLLQVLLVVPRFILAELELLHQAVGQHRAPTRRPRRSLQSCLRTLPSGSGRCRARRRQGRAASGGNVAAATDLPPESNSNPARPPRGAQPIVRRGSQTDGNAGQSRAGIFRISNRLRGGAHDVPAPAVVAQAPG